MKHSLILIAVFLTAIAAEAQRVEQIVENPDAVELRELWRLRGNEGDQIGFGVGGVGDLDGDSYDEWAVVVRGEWLIYRGGETLTTEPIWRMDSVGLPPFHPVVGNFLGDDTAWIGFMHAHLQKIDDVTSVYWQLRLYRPEQGILPMSSSPTQVWDIGVGGGIKDIQAADLDGDGDDELIVARAYSGIASVLIYEGGPNFQVETPTKVIVDDDPIGSAQQYFVHAARLQDFDHVCLITSGKFRRDTGQVQKINFYFGSDLSPWSWSSPDRVLYTTDESISPDWFKLSAYDVDGDGLDDIYGNVYTGSEERVGGYLWLSGSGRNPQTRPYDSTDWDVHYPDCYIYEHEPGPLNDSSYRWNAMYAVPGIDARLFLFNAGEEGPNGTWDAVAGDASQTMFNVGGGCGDVNGDGWQDMIFGNFNYRSRGGIAVIYAGGSYIPNDDSTVSVEEVPIAGRTGGLYLWPNPVRDELHLAWRGDLSAMPDWFVVYDLLGRVVAEGEVETWRGGAVWRCGDVSAGSYQLTIFDRNGAAIATARIIKE